MSNLIAFARCDRAAEEGTAITVLASRLVQIEAIESDDETILDLVVDAEAAALAALAAAPAVNVAEAGLKLAVVLQRLEADDGRFVSAAELAVLRATLADLHRLAQTGFAAFG